MSDECKRIALEGLKGRWKSSVLVAFVVMLFGAQCTSTSDFFSINISNVIDIFKINPEYNKLVIILISAFAFLVIWSVVCFIIRGAMVIGYARYNLHIVDGKDVGFSMLFAGFSRFGDGFIMNLLVTLFTLFWMLLFVIPGIIKSYAYAMAPYILSEYPEITPKEAIDRSRYVMDGNKLNLFFLHLSFIGWRLLCILPILACYPLIIIGKAPVVIPVMTAAVIISIIMTLFVTSYIEAAQAAFYRSIVYKRESDQTLENNEDCDCPEVDL